MTTFVSLFRGINVGGRNMIRMKELKEYYETLGFHDVITFIQSGNVICTTDDTDVTQLAKRIEDGVVQRFGFRVGVIVRTSEEFRESIANNPFQNEHEKESKWILVLFLATPPERTAVEALQKAYTGPEEFSVIGQDMYIYYPNGIGRSKFTLPLIEKKLKTSGTGRNWNTVLQLQQLLDQ